MILSDTTIEELIETERIEVAPEVESDQIQPASLDVRLGKQLYDVDNDVRMIDGDEIMLRPNTAYIGHTQDYIKLPDDVAAMLTGRSSVGRRGVIIHKTAGWIDPGFEGQLTLEMFNFGSDPETFEVGKRIGQLVFFRMDTASGGYDGQYQGQTGITEHGEL